MTEPESEMELPDSQDTDISSVRSDECLVRDHDGVLVKVKDMAFELDDGTDDGTALTAYKQSLKISLAESAALQARNDLLEVEKERLKGENERLKSTLILVWRELSLSLSRSSLSHTCDTPYHGRGA